MGWISQAEHPLRRSRCVFPEEPKAELDVTVAICTRNRRNDLMRAVASLQAPARVRWELLVVDNASDDDTRAACEALIDAFPSELRVVAEAMPGLSHARNRALAEARGRVVVFVDDDATCHAGFVDAHARAFEAPDVVASGGRILPVLPPTLGGRWRRYLETALGGPTGHYDFGSEPLDIPGERDVFLPFGGNVAVRCDMAREVGGFRTDLGFGGQLVPGEETALLERLRDRGRIVYTPGAAVDHHLDPERTRLAYFRRWQRGYGRSLVRMDPMARGMRGLRCALWNGARGVIRAVRRREGFEALRRIESCLGQVLELCDVARAGRAR